MDFKKIEEGVRLLLEGIGEDLSREGLQDTPRRVAEMCTEIFSGIAQSPQLEIGFVDAELENDPVIIRNISFYSVCEHHLLPFFGKVHIAYVPANRKVAGFSSLVRIVETFARRPQIQERLTTQIAEAILKNLQPEGVIVRVEAQQLCVSMRGQRKDEVITVTEAIRGTLDAVMLRSLITPNP